MVWEDQINASAARDAMTSRFREWDGAYRVPEPPWDIGRPQPIVVEIADAGAFRSPVLDAGCGTGENALFLAARGLEVVGVDAAPTAIERARAKAVERDLPARFEVGDALELSTLGRAFAAVLDCGLFHTFGDADRRHYVSSLSSVVEPAGIVHVLCFSDREPWGGGPRRITKAEIRQAFADGWSVESIEPARFATRLHDDGALAWHATIVRDG
jgi:SAM-dependent methyltransferase